MLPTVTPLGLGLGHALAPHLEPISPHPPVAPEPRTLSHVAGALSQRSTPGKSEAFHGLQKKQTLHIMACARPCHSGKRRH